MTIPPNPHPEQVEAAQDRRRLALIERLGTVADLACQTPLPGDLGDVAYDLLRQAAAQISSDRLRLASLAKRPADDGERQAIRAEIINTPETADFMAGVPIEAAHQRERWGSSHDAGKAPEDWFWLIGYLAQKALRAQNAGDTTKALHHTISTAAALGNWHAAIAGVDTSMRPGIMPPQPEGVKLP